MRLVGEGGAVLTLGTSTKLLTAAAISASATLSALWLVILPWPIHAQERSGIPRNAPPITESTNCKEYSKKYLPNSITGTARCMNEQIKIKDKNNKTLAQELKEFDEQIDTNNRETACMKILNEDLIAGGEKTSQLTAVPPAGQACAIARRLGLATVE